MAAQSEFKISFCTACMNRTHHLKQTILKNISDNDRYENLEFILLDYNSQDDMEGWVNDSLSDHIKSGKVVYYKTFEPLSFKHSHSKNLAFKLANNEILCSVNADHYIGENFAHYVNECFANDSKIVLTPIPKLYYVKDKDYPPGDVWGLVCVHKNDFIITRGFDERMVNYGNEDIDFINRLEMLNLKRVAVERSFLSGYIEHSDVERHESISKTDNLHAIYMSYISPRTTETILLYKDKTFEKVIVTDNFVCESEDYRLSYMPKKISSYYSFENVEYKGHWEENNHSVFFRYDKDLQFQLLKFDNILHSAEGKTVYYHLKDPVMVNNVFNFYYYGNNASILQQNLSNKTAAVNPKGFGKAVVFKNFDYNNPIYI